MFYVVDLPPNTTKAVLGAYRGPKTQNKKKRPHKARRFFWEGNNTTHEEMIRLNDKIIIYPFFNSRKYFSHYPRVQSRIYNLDGFHQFVYHR